MGHENATLLFLGQLSRNQPNVMIIDLRMAEKILPDDDEIVHLALKLSLHYPEICKKKLLNAHVEFS